MQSMKDRMLRGELYIAADTELRVELARAQALLERYSRTTLGEQDERDRLLRELLGAVGKGVVVKPTVRCDYGTPITIGAGTFVNYDCVFLDVARSRSARTANSRRDCSLLTATHPIDPEPRRIAQDTVVGAGAVVTRDLPRGVVAVGAPARVVREIGDHDRIKMPDR